MPYAGQPAATGSNLSDATTLQAMLPAHMQLQRPRSNINANGINQNHVLNSLFLTT